MTMRADRAEAFVVYVRVLDAGRRYQVDGGAALGGDLLMHAGLPVPELPGDHHSVAWHLTS